MFNNSNWKNCIVENLFMIFNIIFSYSFKNTINVSNNFLKIKHYIRTYQQRGVKEHKTPFSFRLIFVHKQGRKVLKSMLFFFISQWIHMNTLNFMNSPVSDRGRQTDL